ncbi:MAG TPA: UDP-N-acetylmuramate dehydrogenase [Candidatus Saccharimonadales bacterium]
MDIRQNVSLRGYSTMRLGGVAAYMVDVRSREEVQQAVSWAEERGLPAIMIGGGSNIVWRDEGFSGLVIVNKIMGYEERQEGEDFLVTIGAGENWDAAVARAAEKGLTGIECLSLVPGTTGGTPVQNVGAYGQEIAQTLVSVEAYDRQTKRFVDIPNADCAFGYRTSRFKTTDHGRFFITSITLRLKQGDPAPPFYNALQSYLSENGIHEFTPQIIREAVIAIRRSKLPDPALVANNGSFFANPVISKEHLERLQKDYGEVPNWPAEDGRTKIPAAWLIEKVGFKGAHDQETGMATWPMQPLVLVNEHAQSTAQLLTFRQKILDAIQKKFDITLEQEPELLP